MGNKQLIPLHGDCGYAYIVFATTSLFLSESLSFLSVAYQLITVVIAAAGGGLLLIMGIALIVTCCR